MRNSREEEKYLDVLGNDTYYSLSFLCLYRHTSTSVFSSLLRRFLQRAFLHCFASRFLHIRRAHGHTRPRHRRRQQQQRQRRGRCRQRQRLRQLRICQRHQKEENHSASESAQNLSLYFWNCLWPVIYSRHTRKLFPLSSSLRPRFRPCSYLPFLFFSLWYLSRYLSEYDQRA